MADKINARSNLTDCVIASEVSLNAAASSGKLALSNWNTYFTVVPSTACYLRDV